MGGYCFSPLGVGTGVAGPDVVVAVGKRELKSEPYQPRLLFVCLGNICRSPIAEAIMRAHYGDRCSRIDSAGTASYHIGEAPDASMQRAAKNHAIDLTDLRARQIGDADFYEFDHILAMDESNFRDVQSLAGRLGNTTARVEKFLESGDVPDPYYGGMDGFERVYQIVLRGCDDLAARLGI